MNKLAGVYGIKCIQNGMIYIGESEDISKRWVEHLTDLVSNEHHSYKLQNDFNKYGIKNFSFEIIESILISSENNDLSRFKLKMTLLCREHVNMVKYDSIKNGYNIIDSLIDTVENNHNIFQRDAVSNEKQKNIIKNFLKDNPQLLKDNNVMDNSIVKHKSKSKPKTKDNKQYSNMSDVYKICKETGLISEVMRINDFREILREHNIIVLKNYSWHATDYSLKNNLIVLGKERENQYGFTYNQILFTENGIDTIKNLVGN